jgi:transcriptional regulator with XRE-family HTH domain
MERTINEFWKRVDALLGEDRNQMWLADKTGIRQTTISGWRTNGRMPPADRAVKIAQVLDVSVEYLVTGITRTVWCSQLSRQNFRKNKLIPPLS